MPIQNIHTGMVVSTFKPDYKQALKDQEFSGEKAALNGAGLITLIRVNCGVNWLVLASRKLNPVTNHVENCLALGGGFQHLKGGTDSTFAAAINAAIQYKAPAYPSLKENDSELAPTALVSVCEQWDMQYATLYRVLDLETYDEAKKLVATINKTNEDWNKADRFGLYNLDDLLRIANLTWNMEESHELKSETIKEAALVVNDLASGQTHEQFVIFDDLATAALNRLILNRELKISQSLFTQANFQNDQPKNEEFNVQLR